MSTRVQGIIYDRGKCILLRHVNKKTGRTFWGLPGGRLEQGETEEDGVKREIREETGLEVGILPFILHRKMGGGEEYYENAATFLCWPIAGTARLGNDPEPEEINEWRLTGIKEVDFDTDDGFDPITLRDIHPARNWFAAYPFIRRAGVLCTGTDRDGIRRYLLLTTRKDGNSWILPQGHIEPNETPDAAAVRETKEEAGLDVRLTGSPRSFIYKMNDGVFSLTSIFPAVPADDKPVKGVSFAAPEGRTGKWYTAQEVASLTIPRETALFIAQDDAKKIGKA